MDKGVRTAFENDTDDADGADDAVNRKTFGDFHGIGGFAQRIGKCGEGAKPVGHLVQFFRSKTSRCISGAAR